MDKNFTEEEVIRIFTNSFYCLPAIPEEFTITHPTLVSEEVFIKAGVNLIKEIGPEKYIKNMLENLKGNYV